MYSRALGLTAGLLLLVVAVCFPEGAFANVQAEIRMRRNAQECPRSCVPVTDCPMFAPPLPEWTLKTKMQFKKRVCERLGNNRYTVCCPKQGLELLDLESCGPSSSYRIANGKKAKLFQFPWMALLKSKSGGFCCSGTLVSEQYVLTAAHCIKDCEPTMIRLGEFDLRNTTDCDSKGEVCAPPPQDIPIEEVINHPYYSNRRKENDIGLIRLSRKATKNDNVATICLPVSPMMRTTQSKYVVAGWGKTESMESSDMLLYSTFSLTPKDECQTALRVEDAYIKINDNQLCAMGDNRSDNCLGDSGGPLKTFGISARMVQYGVVSYGLKTCGKQIAPGVYARVESYIDWILGEMTE
ncbi:phenoloxidase-activating factor 3-like [Anopheles nili]|uniref:phenoloxidase-activating factor 3-like n=1 Tax=Anopheles nili TaxID=185578 RepID=UPI00237AC2A2|nr:phenoloxidase-activating factor 3-like [Anopheles nili]